MSVSLDPDLEVILQMTIRGTDLPGFVEELENEGFTKTQAIEIVEVCFEQFFCGTPTADHVEFLEHMREISTYYSNDWYAMAERQYSDLERCAMLSQLTVTTMLLFNFLKSNLVVSMLDRPWIHRKYPSRALMPISSTPNLTRYEFAIVHTPVQTGPAVPEPQCANAGDGAGLRDQPE